MDYFNPGSFMQGDATIESPFLRSMDRATRQNTAAPFIEMMQANQMMDLNKKRMEHQEFASPFAQEARMSGFEKQGVENRQRIRALPTLTDNEISAAIQNIRSLPHMTDAKIAEAQEVVRKIEGTPAAALFQNIAAAKGYLDSLPEGLPREAAARHIINQIKAQYPNAKLPPELLNYNKEAWDTYADIGLNSIEQQNKVKIERMKEDAAQKRVETQGETTRYVADQAYNRGVDVAAARGTGGRNSTKASQINASLEALTNPATTGAPRVQAFDTYTSLTYDEYRKSVDAEIDRGLMEKMADRNAKPKSRQQVQNEVFNKMYGKFLKPVTIEGKTYELIGELEDGTKRIRDPRTGQIGSYRK